MLIVYDSCMSLIRYFLFLNIPKHSSQLVSDLQNARKNFPSQFSFVLSKLKTCVAPRLRASPAKGGQKALETRDL